MNIFSQFNIVDLIILGILAYFIWSGYEQGFVLGVLNFARTVAAFLLSLVFYPQLGDFLSSRFHLTSVVGSVVAFALILIIVEILLGFIISLVHASLFKFLFKFRPLYFADRILGIIPSLAIGLILITTFTLLPLILPIGAQFKNPIEQSFWGKTVIPKAIAYEPAIETLFKRLPTRNLIYIVTKEPESDEVIPIDIPKYTTLKADLMGEEKMLKLLNFERVSRGLPALMMDMKLVAVARAHSTDMLKRGYFSHYSPEKLSPFDRMDQAKIEYTLAGENLAYAPTVEIGHEGLMNSKGHRENILKDGFKKVGIGVIDAGLYGKMFTQDFTD